MIRNNLCGWTEFTDFPDNRNNARFNYTDDFIKKAQIFQPSTMKQRSRLCVNDTIKFPLKYPIRNNFLSEIKFADTLEIINKNNVERNYTDISFYKEETDFYITGDVRKAKMRSCSYVNNAIKTILHSK